MSRSSQEMDYNKTAQYCQECSAISKSVIDDFLIDYAARKEDLESRMGVQFLKYKAAVREIGREPISRLQAEYICHRIFKKDGYIHQYLQRPVIKKLPVPEYKYLQDQSQTPWRYIYSHIIGQPANHFFQLMDVFTGEEYLLYSPGMQQTINEGHNGLWFLLIGFNGTCWQTFGLIVVLPSFTPDDIFFYASEINQKIENNDDLLNELEANPIPFFMLISKSAIPVVTIRGNINRICHATDEITSFNTESLPADFKVKSAKDVLSITFKDLEEPPHFAIAYFDIKNKSLLRTSMTEAGFKELSNALQSIGYKIDNEPDLNVSTTMLIAARGILNKKIEINPYEKLFRPNVPKSNDDTLAKINKFIQLAMPYYNNKQKIDVLSLAKEAGLDEENAISVWGKLQTMLEEKRIK